MQMHSAQLQRCPCQVEITEAKQANTTTSIALAFEKTRLFVARKRHIGGEARNPMFFREWVCCLAATPQSILNGGAR